MVVRLLPKTPYMGIIRVTWSSRRNFFSRISSMMATAVASGLVSDAKSKIVAVCIAVFCGNNERKPNARS